MCGSKDIVEQFVADDGPDWKVHQSGLIDSAFIHDNLFGSQIVPVSPKTPFFVGLHKDDAFLQCSKERFV